MKVRKVEEKGKIIARDMNVWLGLDVHDVGRYKRAADHWRTLEPGMVLTVEPGLYFGSAVPESGNEYVGIGVRIEDDVLITAEGCENLTAALPSAAEDVEGLVGVS